MPDSIAAAYLWGVHSTPLVVPTGGSPSLVPWAHFQTTDPAVFGTATTNGASPPYHNATGDSYIYLRETGAYLAVGSCVFESGAYEQGMVIGNPGGEYVLDFGGASVSPAYTLPSEDILDNTVPALIQAQYGLFSHRMFYVDLGASAGIVRMEVYQSSGSNKNLPNATLGIYYFGNAQELTQVY